ncbi:MAG: MATE family efflux transporter [Firmicutes bacterium]|nr:MATE family efflux transporter [Bacillota bacterium]
MDENKVMRKRVLTLAVPSIIENMLLSIVEYADTAMVGSLGPMATAAVAVNTPVTWLFNSTIMAISVGGTVAVAQSVGAGKNEKAKRLTDQAFMAVVLFSAVVLVGLLVMSRWIPVWMGAEPEIIDTAVTYLRIIAVGLPFAFISIVFNGILRGSGDTKTPLKLNMLANILNVIGNFLLIFPERDILIGDISIHMWGAGWGVAGAAISTTISRAVAAVLVILMMTRQPVIKLTISKIIPDRELLGQIFRIGIPSALERLSISSGQIVFFRVVSSLGTASLAAHQLANTAESLAYMPAFGFQIAATTLVGQLVGARDFDGARKSCSVTFRLALIVTLGFTAVLLLGADFLIGMFTPSEEVVHLGASALRIMAVAETFSTMAMVYTGALRGAGDTKQPFFVCIVSMWGIRIPLSFILVHVFHLGLSGAWVAMAMDQMFRGLLMMRRFKKNGWEKRLSGLTM